MHRPQFTIRALLVAMLVVGALFVAAFFGAMAFFFKRDGDELREALWVEQENSAKTQNALRKAVSDLIQARHRIEELESR